MFPNHLHKLFHRLNLAPHGTDTPSVQKPTRPIRTLVLPKSLEIFLHQVRPDHPQVVTQQLRQLLRLLVRQVFRIFQKNVFALRQDRLPSLRLEFANVFLSRFIHRIRQVSLHMEPIKDVQRLRTDPADPIQVRLPHVAANPLDLFRTLFPAFRALIELLEKILQRRLGAFFLNAEQSFVLIVELINKRRVMVSLLDLDLIDSNGFHTVETPVFQAPIDNPFHGTINLAECRTETFGDFRPTQSSRPVRKELPLFDGLRVLAIAPRNRFRYNAMLRTGDSPHSVHKVNGNRPKGHELPPAMFLSGVVGRAGLAAFGTDSFAVFAGLDFDDEVLLFGRFAFLPDFSEDEGLVIGDGIEYGFQLHLGLLVGGIVSGNIYSTMIYRDVFVCYLIVCLVKQRQALLKGNLSRNSRSKDVTFCHESQVVRRLGDFSRPHSCPCLKKPIGNADLNAFYPHILS